MAKSILLLATYDQDTTALAQRVATEMFFSVHTADNKTFAEKYDELNPEVVVLDITTTDMKGFELLQFLKERQSEAVILLLSGRQDSYRRLVEHLSMAMKLNIHDNLPKPFRDMELRQQLREIQMALLASKHGGYSQEAIG